MDKEAQKMRSKPYYAKIYKDLIQMKFPQRFKDFADLLEKKELSHFEVEQLNEKLFGKKTKSEKQLQQKYKAYDEKTIKQILQYQKKHELNNVQLANHFKLSRNTVTKWKKIFNH